MALKWLTKSVAAANTAVALTSTRTYCSQITVQASKNNKDGTYVGDSNTSSTSDQGFFLSVTDGKAYFAQRTFTSIAPGSLDLSQIYISSASSISKVNVLYIEE